MSNGEEFERELRRDLPRGVQGGQDRLTRSGWADPRSLGRKIVYEPGKIFLGYRGGVPLGVGDDRHLLTVAGSRAGKGVSLVIPNLLLYEGSALVIDPKGELARETLGVRVAHGHRCFVLDPMGISGYASSSFNPLSELDPESPTIVDDAAQVAEALVVSSEREPHWGDNARRLVKALILYALFVAGPTADFALVLDLLSLTDKEVKQKAARDNIRPQEALFLMLGETEDVFGGEMAREGAAFCELYKQSEREFAAIVSTARTQLEFLGSRALMDTLRGSDFSLKDLKAGKTTIYLCVPASLMIRYSPWLRLIITLALIGFERYGAKPKIPVLVVLEEFNVLGHMAVIAAAAGQIAGYGVKLWTVLQDLGQIENLYKGSWETFVGNAGVLTFFGNTDMRTLEYVSRKLGGTGMIIERASGASMSAIYGGAKSSQEDLRESPLLHPHEIERVFARERNRMLVLIAGREPLVVERVLYHEANAFRKLWDIPSVAEEHDGKGSGNDKKEGNP